MDKTVLNGNTNLLPNMRNDYIIIVAGGKGLRMGTDIPKQFLPIDGMPVLMHTIKRFWEYSDRLKIILVLPETQQEYWHELCRKYDFNITHTIANGGKTRFHSVSNGLAMIPDDAQGIVGVHDGVRPFVSTEVIARCFEGARASEAVIPVTPVVETLRHLTSEHVSNTVQRNNYRLVQTPQTFDIQLLKHAYSQPYKDDFTDDASVVESLGKAITMVDGNRENIKITTQFDLIIAPSLVAMFKNGNH